MVTSEYEQWLWAKFLESLDKAGYAIVKKPTKQDMERGAPGWGKAH